MLDWRKDKKLPKETVRCIYSFIHFFVLCPKSIPFLYVSRDHNGNYLRWHDHFRSILGIICSLRIICGWGSFTILYRSHVTNDAISCNYSNYCIQNKHKNSYENDTDDTQYLIDDTLILLFNQWTQRASLSIRPSYGARGEEILDGGGGRGRRER